MRTGGTSLATIGPIRVGVLMSSLLILPGCCCCCSVPSAPSGGGGSSDSSGFWKALFESSKGKETSAPAPIEKGLSWTSLFQAGPPQFVQYTPAFECKRGRIRVSLRVFAAKPQEPTPSVAICKESGETMRTLDELAGSGKEHEVELSPGIYQIRLTPSGYLSFSLEDWR